jgi:hypothetical protein
VVVGAAVQLDLGLRLGVSAGYVSECVGIPRRFKLTGKRVGSRP